ncbi:hypothetical protein ACSYAY_09485 [Leptospirillum ferriphilum]|nr:hypothetical protein [Leptospirillum ferriphilum]
MIGRSLFNLAPCQILAHTRLSKYLFYELIASPDSVRLFRTIPEAGEALDKALLWYFNYRDLFVTEGKVNSELEILSRERKTRLLGWKDWFSDRHVFLKGLKWQKII